MHLIIFVKKMKSSTRILIVILVFLFAYLMYYQFIKEERKIAFNGETQGTYYAVTYFDKKDRNFQPEINHLLAEFDLIASTWVHESIISKINQNDPNVQADDIFIQLYLMSKRVYEETNGSFDPSVGPLVNAWGFGHTERMDPDSAFIDSLLQFVGFDKVKLDQRIILKEDGRIQFDFNAIAQGYAVDLIGQFLESKEIHHYLVDIGGEVKAKGQKPSGEAWLIGIELPTEQKNYGQTLSAKVQLKNQSLATSGNYRKFYVKEGIKYAHTIDPKTGFPVQHTLLSATVLADITAYADAYATAFMVMGVEKTIDFLADRNDLQAYLVFSGENGELQVFMTDEFRTLLVK